MALLRGGGSAASRAASGVFLRGRLCSHVPSGQAASGQGLPGGSAPGRRALETASALRVRADPGTWVHSRRVGMLPVPGSSEFLKPGSGCWLSLGQPWEHLHGDSVAVANRCLSKSDLH